MILNMVYRCETYININNFFVSKLQFTTDKPSVWIVILYLAYFCEFGVPYILTSLRRKFCINFQIQTFKKLRQRNVVVTE